MMDVWVYGLHLFGPARVLFAARRRPKGASKFWQRYRIDPLDFRALVRLHAAESGTFPHADVYECGRECIVPLLVDGAA